MQGDVTVTAHVNIPGPDAIDIDAKYIVESCPSLMFCPFSAQTGPFSDVLLFQLGHDS